MNTQIQTALLKLFDRHRIIFWYDIKRELREDYEALSLPGIEKLKLTNNEYGVKYRLLREEPLQKFLLYHEGPQPKEEVENWLLDVQLAQGTFSTDQVAIWLSELGLDLEYSAVVQDHVEFFQAVKRKDALKKLLKERDTSGQIRLSMLAVCAGGCDPRVDTILENLLKELADEKDDMIKLIGRCGLEKYLWEQMDRHYGYKSDVPGIRDFVIELFKSCYAMGTVGQIKLTSDALVFLKRWKDSRQFEDGFEKLSAECTEVLGTEQDLTKRDFRGLIELDYFELIDRKIISDLVREVTARTVSSGDVSLWIRQRRQSHWFQKYEDVYAAIDYAAQFIQALGDVKLDMNCLVDGIQRYSRFWYQLDQLYRKFTYHVRKSGQASLMVTLTEQIENLYSNSYLLKLGDSFQSYVDEASTWDASPIPLQVNFFERYVRPFLVKDNKVCVIISDAMRYEIGDELLSRIRQEDRYSATLEAALSMLPSYTQLGMAALLPHKELAIADNETGTVQVDNKSSQGIVNRGNILRAGMAGKTATTITADDFMNMPRDGEDGYRSLFSSNDVVYIYHNRIDASGDKRDSEERVFEAVEETLSELILIIRKLSTANATNMIVTADHGFIYQNRAIDESDYSGVDAEGEKILFRDRRFVLGKGLYDTPSLHKFTSPQLGLTGEVEVQIPKSINRLRLKGSGSRYVHGGASLQEVVIPILNINKKRQSDLTSVEVDILRGTSSVITSGQLAVVLYQVTPATDKIKPRVLRAGIYTESGDLISDSHELTFDLTSNNTRERELQVRFVLSRKAEEVNGQEVILKLEEKLAGTSHYKDYKSLRYTMRRAFTSDFDF